MKLFKNTSTPAPRRQQADSSGDRARSFRRNQTLTGSVSDVVRSPGEHSAHLKSPRVHAHHLTHKRRKVAALLVMTLLASTILYILINQFTASMRVNIASLPTQAEVQKRYQPILEDYYGRHPAERLRFLLDETALLHFVQLKAPEIRAVHVEGSGEFALSQVTLSARRPVAGWTARGIQEYVDDRGVSFGLNYFDEPAVRIVDNSGIPASDGQAIASNRFLGFVGRLVGALDSRGHVVTKVVIPLGTTRQVDLELKGSSYPVTCSVDRSAGEQAEDIARIVRYFKTKGTTPQHVDVRVSGKAFYR